MVSSSSIAGTDLPNADTGRAADGNTLFNVEPAGPVAAAASPRPICHPGAGNSTGFAGPDPRLAFAFCHNRLAMPHDPVDDGALVLANPVRPQLRLNQDRAGRLVSNFRMSQRLILYYICLGSRRMDAFSSIRSAEDNGYRKLAGR